MIHILLLICPIGDCLGVRKVPYKRIRSGEVKVTGLPDGVAFKSPSTYGISMLQKLTDQSSAIIFRGNLVYFLV